MTVEHRLDEVVEALVARGLTSVEAYRKRGRSRRLAVFEGWWEERQLVEEGWAVRAGDRNCSFFAAGSGPCPIDHPWPTPDGHPLRLPPASVPPPWGRPASFDRPVVSESEGRALVEAIGRSLEEEIPGARLRSAVLEDGASSAELVSSKGVRGTVDRRVASLRLEASQGRGPLRTTLIRTGREARQFHPPALGRRLADRLIALSGGASPERDRGEFLLAPPLGARILEGLLPLWIGAPAKSLASALAERDGRIASSCVTVIDDGRLPEGALVAPVDGEGVPTAAVRLVEEGVYRQPLLSWREADEARGRTSGCARRASWRDLPRVGPTHLYLAPDPEVGPGELLASVSRGYYLLDAAGVGRFDLRAGRFAIPVFGFEIQGGKATSPVGEGWLCGAIQALLRGMKAVARDLDFEPLDGMIGSPSLLVAGLELRRRA